MTKQCHRLAGLTLGAAALGLLAAPALAQTSFAEIEAAARTEGQLVIYASTHDSEMQETIALFEAAYPEIRVQSIRLPSGQLFSRFIGEQEAGVVQADFLASGSSALYQQRPELFFELTGENIPNLQTKPLIEAVNPHYTVFQIDPHLVTYNTDLVTLEELETHLATWEGLADPRWRGKIALNDPRNSPNQVSFLIMLRDTYGAEWFEGFNANQFELVGTASAGSQQVAAGAYEILLPTIPTQSAAVRAEGGPVGTYLPGGAVHAPAQGMAVPLDAPHPNAGLVFLNWKLGQEGQALTCRFGGVPVFPVEDPECTASLPEEFMLGIDVIDAETQSEVFGLVGLRP